MRTSILALAISLATSAAHSEPIYLTCSSDGETRFSVKLDESNGKITHTRESAGIYDAIGSAFNAEGFFSANEISYQNISFHDPFKNIDQYKINRTDLSYAHTHTITSNLRGITMPPSTVESSYGLVDTLN